MPAAEATARLGAGPDAGETTQVPIGWFGIVRLGLVQAALGAVVVLTTSTLNRVMVVELALPALLGTAVVAAGIPVHMLLFGRRQA